MKDEEMAEEQKLCLKAQSFKEDVKAHDIDVINAVENKLDAYKVGRYDGFLAGLKAGRPQWHDLRKDPNDLPICNKSGISTAKMTDKGKWAIYISSRKEWYTKLSDKIEVCQWCDLELPTFDKE